MSETLIDLGHREAVIELERVSRLGEPTGERFAVMVPAPLLSWDQAVRDAVSIAGLAGKPCRPRKIVMAQNVMGFCRDCGESVFQGGNGRIRTTELRCWACGGGP